AILELFSFLGRTVSAGNAFELQQMLLQIFTLLARQLDDVIRIGRDAPFVRVFSIGAGLVQVFAVGPPEGGSGQFERSAVVVVDRLHAAFAVAAFAHDRGTLMILKRRRDNLAGTGTFAIDQADERHIGDVAIRAGAHRVALADSWANAH